jgi:RimJ/RimL family protein N-acetyltransferase
MMDTIKGKTIQLRYATPDDAEFVYGLRVDPDRNKFVSPISGGAENQREWLVKYKQREAQGLEHYFIIEKAAIPIGTVRIYDLQPDSFCWGSWMMVPRAPSSAAVESAVLLYEFAFYELGYSKSHFDVRLDNERVIAFHQRFGAKIVRSTDLDHYFVYSKEEYEKVRQRYAKFIGE